MAAAPAKAGALAPIGGTSRTGRNFAARPGRGADRRAARTAPLPPRRQGAARGRPAGFSACAARGRAPAARRGAGDRRHRSAEFHVSKKMLSTPLLTQSTIVDIKFPIERCVFCAMLPSTKGFFDFPGIAPALKGAIEMLRPRRPRDTSQRKLGYEWNDYRQSPQRWRRRVSERPRPLDRGLPSGRRARRARPTRPKRWRAPRRRKPIMKL